MQLFLIALYGVATAALVGVFGGLAITAVRALQTEGRLEPTARMKIIAGDSVRAAASTPTLKTESKS
jgi:hypothetical protein